MNTVTEIEAELAKLVATMAEKGIASPEAQLHIKGAGRFSVYASCNFQMIPFNGESHFRTLGDTAAEAIKKAHAFLAAIGVNEYMKYVNGAIDIGTRVGIADEYLAPLYSVKKAIADNLLPHGKEDVA